MFKNRSVNKAQKIAIFILCLSFCIFFALPTYAADEKTFNNDPVKLTAGFIMEAEITVENDTVILTQTKKISDNDYRIETVFIVPEANKSADDVLSDISDFIQRASGSQYVEEFDGSGSIKGWLRVYYTKGSSSYGSTVKVTSVSGGYTRYDVSVTVSTQSLYYGCSGKSATTGYYIGQNDNKTPSGSSWSYTAPSSWHPIVQDSYCNAGANCTFTLRRGTGTNTWSFTIYCIVSQV